MKSSSSRRRPGAGAVTDTIGAARLGLLGIAAVMACGLLLSGCNTTAGVGRDVSATGAAVTRSATDVKNGL